MKLIKPKAELLIQPSGLEGVYKQIEKCGRTCYRSEDKITEDSAKPFVDRMCASKHTAMLEHGTVYLKIPVTNWGYLHYSGEDSEYDFDYYPYHLCFEKYSKMKIVDNYAYVTTNFRVIIENNWLNDLQYICEPTEFHEKRYTFRMITSIGVTRELNRHRVNSIAEQSTRYCNYSKDKFGEEITVVIPSWCECLVEGNSYDMTIAKICGESEDIKPLEQRFIMSNCFAEEIYMEYIHDGWVPQQAREVLPLCTATEIVHTAFASDWKHFFDLRLFGKTGNPHPNMKQLAQLMYDEAEKHGILDDVINK